MKKIIHRADSRGNANHGWLIAKHSFSFSSWYDAGKMNFGALRVLNDDEVAGGKGFGRHPHQDMEIITLVQQGTLAHQDSLNNGSIMRPDDIQVMSAGTGVFHSEINHSPTDKVKLFQIWIEPNKTNVNPRYAQQYFDAQGRKNQWQQIIKPDTQTEGEAIFIHQQAWLSLADLDQDTRIMYQSPRSGNGIYLMVIEGQIQLAGELLDTRDAIGLTEAGQISLTATTNARVLMIDVPMNI